MRKPTVDERTGANELKAAGASRGTGNLAEMCYRRGGVNRDEKLICCGWKHRQLSTTERRAIKNTDASEVSRANRQTVLLLVGDNCFKFFRWEVEGMESPILNGWT